MDRYQKDWNSQHLPAIGGEDLFATFFRYIDWTHATEAGLAFSHGLQVEYWLHLLDNRAGESGLGVLYQEADLFGNGSQTPGTPMIRVEESGRRIQLKAHSLVQDDLPAEVLLFYILSPERTLRLPSSVWQMEPMHPAKGSNGEFESALLPAWRSRPIAPPSSR